ncbi:MAG: hypothetical protein WBW69_02335 [Candidatus Korobacteraceae bacterium]
MPSGRDRVYLGLFLISFLILFFELTCIRWFGSTVIYFTFFTNIVLLATFLGMSVDCLTASGRRDWTGRVLRKSAWAPAVSIPAPLASAAKV